MTETPDNSEELLGGRYRPGRRLGSGGMASVHAAEDTVLGRTVALKRLRTDAEEDQVERFRREARLGAGLNHPNLVGVYDILSDDDAVLIVMEYVDGEALSELLEREGRLDPERALPILRGIAAALDHAHDAGIVHRDIKPENVLLTEDGRAKLVDLGIASAAEETRLTAAHQVIGTLSYMPPERLSAETAGDRSSDVYSLAMLALRTLSGELPWRGFDPAERLRHAEREAPDVGAAWPEAPDAACAAIVKSLDPDPSLRHASAGALAADLAEALPAAGAERAPTAATAAFAAPTEEPAPAGAGTAAASPAPPPDRVIRGGRTPSRYLGIGLAAAALIAVLAVVALSGDDGGEPRAGGDGNGSAASEADGSGGGGQGVAPESAPSPAPDSSGDDNGSAPAPSSFASGGPEDDARGAALNERGYELIQSGEPDKAVSVLRRSVRAFPEGTDDIRYAYALFNLGNALRLSGSPGEAIPVLEARLQIPDQTETVRQELEAARAAAS